MASVFPLSAKLQVDCTSSAIRFVFLLSTIWCLSVIQIRPVVGNSNTAPLMPNSALFPKMSFLGRHKKYRRYGQTGPYGPAAAFAIGSGERLAARRREMAQTKAFMRRYPGILPPVVNVVAGGIFEYDRGTSHMNGFSSVPHGASFGQFKEDDWEDPAVIIPHPVLRNSFRTLPASASSRTPAFGTQWQCFWPGGHFSEGVPGNQGMRRPTSREDLLEELYTWRHPEGDYLDAYGGIAPRPFPHSFDDYQRRSFGPPQSMPFGNHRYHTFEGGRDDVPSVGQDDPPDRRGQFEADGPRSRSRRGSPRDSYERLRPEDL